jgi:Phage capsid scaffolding protein (GPO) serine peptidase
MAKSKFLRVAVAGFTASDGRTIEPEWLTQMAETYNPATFTARVNVEHIRNLSADGPFPALGDVLALKTQTDDIDIAGKTEKRICLYAQIEGNDILQGYLARDQKKFTSIEIEPSFSGTGKAYLMGLAATDNPASLGTEALKFSAGGDAYAKQLKATLDGRKQHASCLFSAAIETAFEFETGSIPAPDAAGGFMEKFFSGLDARFGTKAQEPKVEDKPATGAAIDQAALAGMFKDFGTSLQQGLQATFAERDQAQAAALNKVTSEFAALKQQIETTPSTTFTQRPEATGSHEAVELTDC